MDEKLRTAVKQIKWSLKDKEKPLTCQEPYPICKNKVYGRKQFSAHKWYWVCKKHFA